MCFSSYCDSRLNDRINFVAVDTKNATANKNKISYKKYQDICSLQWNTLCILEYRKI